MSRSVPLSVERPEDPSSRQSPGPAAPVPGHQPGEPLRLLSMPSHQWGSWCLPSGLGRINDVTGVAQFTEGQPQCLTNLGFLRGKPS